MTDEDYMQHAISLAAKGLNTTDPNPRVGCVIVRDHQIIAEGWHQYAGGPHAEAVALNALTAQGKSAQGATLYVTLEPCCHFGRTPPCCGRIIDAGISRVVAAMRDPNPVVCGQGFSQLTEAGIEVRYGVCESAAEALNPGFMQRFVRGRPWIRLKIAASLDGRTALRNGVSQWITAAAARKDGHLWRARASAILTGSGTVLADNPSLTVRDIDAEFKPPLRVIIDGQLRLARVRDHLTSNMLHELQVLQPISPPGSTHTLVCTALPQEQAAAEYQLLQQAGVEVHCLTSTHDAQQVDLAAVMILLAQRGCNEIHVEGGERLNGALLNAGLVDEMIIYLAPRLLGNEGRGMFQLPELTTLDAAPQLQICSVTPVGDDWRIIARPRND